MKFLVMTPEQFEMLCGGAPGAADTQRGAAKAPKVCEQDERLSLRTEVTVWSCHYAMSAFNSSLPEGAATEATCGVSLS